MKNFIYLLLIGTLTLLPKNSFAQVDPEEMGAWYMYIFNTRFKNDSLWESKVIFNTGILM